MNDSNSPADKPLLDPTPLENERFPAGLEPVLESPFESTLESVPQSRPEPNDPVIIEVELAPAATGLADAIAAIPGNPADSIFGSGGAGAAGNSLVATLRAHGLQEAQSVFTGDQAAEEERKLQQLRAQAALGAVDAELPRALEQLAPLGQFVRLRFGPDKDPREVIRDLKRLPEVAQVAWVPPALPPQLMPLPDPPPDDPLVGQSSVVITDPVTGLDSQWYLERTRVPAAWQYARGEGVVLADIDWGYRTSHEEFAGGAIEKTYNAVDGSTVVTHGKHASHGTAVLGLAGARANGAGIAGYAPKATLWAIQGDSAAGASIFRESWAEAINYVRCTTSDGRRKIINLEVQTWRGGNYEQIPSIRREIKAAIAEGCVVCVAAGNGNRPADLDDYDQPYEPTGSILVGATAYHPTLNQRASFSNYGSRIVVSAPGDPAHDVTCGQSADNAYVNAFGGTSGATPKVAGTAALMLSVNPVLSHNDIRDILVGTGTPLTEDPGKPVGVFLNAEAAVAEALHRKVELDAAQAAVSQESPEPESGKRKQGVHRRKGLRSLSPQGLSFEDSESRGANIAANLPNGEIPPTASDQLLRQFRNSVGGTLTQQERIAIVEQAIQLLDNFYVHRPLKEAMHAVRPTQRLRVFQRRLQRNMSLGGGAGPELEFHNTLTQIFNSVRDLHTNYQLPRPFRDYVAFLPFEVAPFYKGKVRRYMVTRVVNGYQFAHPAFGVGAELTYWNGMPVERAVQANAEQTAGGNEAARHARGMSALTIRPMNTALPPDADFTELEFLRRNASPNDKPETMRQHWFVRYTPSILVAAAPAPAQAAVPAVGMESRSLDAMPPSGMNYSLDVVRESVRVNSESIFGAADPPPPASAPVAPPATASEAGLLLGSVLGLDVAADSVREAREIIFAQSASPAAAAPASAHGNATPVTVDTNWTAAFSAYTIHDPISGKDYGHIKIKTFYFEDANGFVKEFVRLLQQMPDEGLILDVRGNGGGNILAAELLLQTLTPVTIEPERLQFIVSAGTLDLCRYNQSTSGVPLGQWLASLEGGVETGSIYSQAFSLTDRESCNALGQKYYGPVVLVVDGNCYSATDIFAAGFQDHGIGQVLGVAEATGAGGANVWTHALLCKLLPAGWGLKPLPGDTGMRVAIRQCLRVGPQAGSLLEDFGVVPDQVALLTENDVLSHDVDLMAKAAALLRGKGSYGMRPPSLKPGPPGMDTVEIQTRNLQRIDVYLNGRPIHSAVANPVQNLWSFDVPQGRDPASQLRVLGFANPKDPTPAALLKEILVP